MPQSIALEAPGNSLLEDLWNFLGPAARTSDVVTSVQRALITALAVATAVACDARTPRESPSAAEAPPPDPSTSAPPPPGPKDVPQLTARRKELLGAGNVAEAESVCRTWLAKQDDDAKSEAHKCLANVFAHQAKDNGGKIMVSSGGQRLAVGGLAGPPRFSGMEMVQAIEQLDKAAELSPADLSIHQGRLFLCLASGRYERGVASLELSTVQHEGARAEMWLEYMGHFPRSAAEHAVAFADIIVQANPKSASALVALGAWQAVAGDTAKARATLAKAIAAAPNDAMAHWRMGELIEQGGDRKGASAAFRKSLSLDGPFAEERQSAYEHFAEREPQR